MMLTIYKYFKEKTSSILKSVFIFLAWRQGLGALHLESRQLLKTCQSALWFIPWFFFFPPSPPSPQLHLYFLFFLFLPSQYWPYLWPSCFFHFSPLSCVSRLFFGSCFGGCGNWAHHVSRPAPTSAHPRSLRNVFLTTCLAWDWRTILDWLWI